MKLLTDYLEHALQFERLASEETNPEIKAQFESQAARLSKVRRGTRGKIRPAGAKRAEKHKMNSCRRSLSKVRRAHRLRTRHLPAPANGLEWKPVASFSVF